MTSQGAGLTDPSREPISTPPQHEQPLFSEHIGQPGSAPPRTAAALVVHREPLLDHIIRLLAQREKVANGARMDIWRFIPISRPGRRHRHAAGPHQLPAQPPVTEIWEADDGARAD